MNWLGVLERIAAGEGASTECKRGLDLPGIGRTMCAFANTEGGVIILGVDDSQSGLEPLRYGGRVWVRRARSSVEPSPTELQELYNVFGYIVTEERSIQAATSTHIDLARFRAYLHALGLDTEEEPQPGEEDDLRNRGVLTGSGDDLRATLERAVGWFAGLGRFEAYRGILREDRALLPQPALREALVNAVVHRDYAITGSDRAPRLAADRHLAGRRLRSR